jgi:CRP-like cAMP-binding protein
VTTGSASPFERTAGPGDEAAVEGLIRQFEQRDGVSDTERTVLRTAIGETRVYPAGDVVIRAGVPVESSTLLVQGLLARVLYTASGRRQILAVHVPGDFVDLHGFLLKRLDHDVVALTDAVVALMPHARLRTISEEQPHLTRLLWKSTTIDAALHRAWAARLSLSAAMRIAHLMCELSERLAVTGSGTRDAFALDLTQIDIADMTSLTPVHVNRTLRQLRETGMFEWRGGMCVIANHGRLCDFSSFDPGYLYLEREPR